MRRELGVNRRAAGSHLLGGRGLPWDLRHYGGTACAAAAEIFSEWRRSLSALKAHGARVGFSFLLHLPSF